MLRIGIAIIAALTLALGLVTWRLKVAWQDNAVIEQQLDSANQQLRDAEVREKAIDETVGKLIGATRDNAKKLNQTLEAIRDIKPEPGDTHESIDCLDRPLPAALDRSLRHPRNQDGHSAGNPAR